MKPSRAIPLGLILVAGGGSYAMAQVGGMQTAGELERWCEFLDQPPLNGGVKELNQAVMCIGYMAGIADGMGVAADYTKRTGKPVPICFPPNVTTDEVRRIFLKYLKDQPEALHETARIELSTALTKAFRCTEK